MKRILFYIVFSFSLVAAAQVPQVMSTWYQYKRAGTDSLLNIPRDTLKVPEAYKQLGWIARKDDNLYLWSPTLNKWVQSSGGGGGGGNVNTVFGRSGNVTAQASDYNTFYPGIQRFLDSIAAVRAYAATGSETDPIWNGEKNNYYTKVQSDGRYLQSFTETDPNVGIHIKNITATNISNWNTAYNKSPASIIFSGGATKTMTLTLFDGSTIQGSFTDLSGTGSGGITEEVDPTVAAHIKSITTNNINNWNTAFGWGNHAGLYPTIQRFLDSISAVRSAIQPGGLTNETDPLFDTKFAGKSTTNLVEGTNLYYTPARVQGVGDARYPQLSGTYANPSWLTSLPASKITGLATVATSGNYNDLSNKPTSLPPSAHTHAISDVTNLSFELGTKFNTADSGSMLQPYLRKADTTRFAHYGPDDLEFVIGVTTGAPTAGANTITLTGSAGWEARLYRGKVKQSRIDDGSGIYYSKPLNGETLTLYGDTWKAGELVQIVFYRSAFAIALSGGGPPIATGNAITTNDNFSIITNDGFIIITN